VTNREAARELNSPSGPAYNVHTREAMPIPRRRERRIHLRATEHDVARISRAAAAAGVTVSAFILASAAEMADRTLADQRHFELSDRQWRAFTEALDQPVRRIPELEKLMREPSILERS
jgi:uncharacterized protein (DUF1778 family)